MSDLLGRVEAVLEADAALYPGAQSIDALRERARLWLPTVKPATVREYAKVWPRFRAWARPPSNGGRPERWLAFLPASDDTLAQYTDHMCQLGLAPATITKIKSAIMAWHRLHGVPVPDGRPASVVLRRYKDSLEAGGWRPETAEPLLFAQVIAMLNALDRGKTKGRRDAALLLLAYAAALEPGQMTALRLRDVVTTREGLRVHRGDGDEVLVPHWRVAGEHRTALCPVETIGAWRAELHGQDDDRPFIRAVDRHGHIAGVDAVWAGPAMPVGGVSVEGLLYSLAGMLLGAGLDPRVYRWESLRRGGLIDRRLKLQLTADELAGEAGLAPTSVGVLDLIRRAERQVRPPRSTAGAGAVMVDAETGL